MIFFVFPLLSLYYILIFIFNNLILQTHPLVMIVPLIVASLILAASAVPREYGKQFSEFTAQNLCIHSFLLFHNNNNNKNNNNSNNTIM